jgi:hypothetical protein
VPEEAEFDAARASLEDIVARSLPEARRTIDLLSERLSAAPPIGGGADPAFVAAFTRERVKATRAMPGEAAAAMDPLLVARCLEAATEPERARLLRAWLPYLTAAGRGQFASNPAVHDPRMESASTALHALFASLRAYFRVGLFWTERTGIPRRWIVQARSSERLRLVRYIATRLGGFKPVWETHMPKQPPGVHLTEAAFVGSHVEIARALERHPKIRGIASTSWFYDPEIAVVSPHLAFIHELLAANDCFVFEVPCDEPMRENALHGSRARQVAHAAGTYRPRAFARVWSRDALLRWAKRQPGWKLEGALPT